MTEPSVGEPSATQPSRRVVRLPGPIALRRTLRRTAILGFDPAQRAVDGEVHCAFRTEDGVARVRYAQRGEREVEVEAWGPGAARALEAAPAHLGADDAPETLVTDHPVVAPLAERYRGLRFGRTGRPMEHLVPVIIGQKVTGKGASRSFKELVFRYGEPVPGPGPKLWLMPAPERFRELAYYDFHPLGIERKRAQILLTVTRRAKRIERLAREGQEALERQLMALPGIGPWTTAHVSGAVFGDADAVPVGDYHLPNVVVHALTGRARGDDDEMLALLEPFRPHRGRVLLLLAMGGAPPPKFGPRSKVRDIRGS